MNLFKGSYQKKSDEELMTMVVKGDAKAFEVVYDRYSGPLFNYFHRMLWQDRLLAEDFTQELFMKVAHKAHTFDTSKRFKTWLYSVASNMCKNEYKRQQVRAGERQDSADQMEMESGQEASPSVLADRSGFREELEEALKGLSQAHRDVFEMRYMQGLSLKEIAESTDSKEGTVKSRLYYCCKYLAEELEHYHELIN